MKATFVDLRSKSAQIIAALRRNEKVTLFYRGKPAAEMRPVLQDEDHTPSACDDPAFGMWAERDDLKKVDQHVRELRRGRHHDF